MYLFGNLHAQYKIADRARPGSRRSRDPGRDLAILSRPGPGRDFIFGRDLTGILVV